MVGGRRRWFVTGNGGGVGSRRRKAVPGLVGPRIGTAPDPKRETVGSVVIDVASRLGLTLHPWQQHRANVCGELVAAKDGGRRLAAQTTLTLAGRQTGKTTAVTADVATRCLAPDLPELAGLVGHPVARQHVAFTAQDRIGALGRWYEHVDMIMASDLAGFVAKVVRKNGEECLHWCNGSKYRVVTPSKTGARGLSLDLVVIDEALAHDVDLLAVLGPTMAQRDGARDSFGAQLVIVSNAGDEDAELLNTQREIGRRAVAEHDPSFVLLEWSCWDDDDVLDPKVWAATVPTLDCPDGLTTAFLARQAETIGTDAFAREYLCRTVLSARRQVIDPQVWERLPHVELARAGPEVVLAVEFDPDRVWATIVVAGLVDDWVGVEVVDERDGVDWVTDRLVELVARSGARVVVDRFGPAAPLVPALRQADVDVVEVGTREVTDAAGSFVDMVIAGRVGHTGDPRLTDSLVGLARRQRGDRWGFDRHVGRPAPIIAASLAAWVVATEPVRVPVIH